MRYLGLDVHGAATVYCLLDAAGAIVERGSVTTTFTALTELARRLSRDEELTAGQEVGTMCHFVHDIFTSVGVRIIALPRRSSQPQPALVDFTRTQWDGGIIALPRRSSQPQPALRVCSVEPSRTTSSRAHAAADERGSSRPFTIHRSDRERAARSILTYEPRLIKAIDTGTTR